MTEIVLLGSGGWIPTSRRATCSALLLDGGHAVVIDAGTGIARLIEDPALLAGVQRLDIVLTHFHLDHVVGLAYLPALALAEPPRLYGPGVWLYGTATEEIVARLVGPPFAIGLPAMSSSIGEIEQGGIELASIRVAARVQERHSDPTLALRFGDDLAYCTDTAYDGASAEFARGVRVLAHEAWYTEDAPREQESHSSARQAAQVARDAQVGELALIHVRPGVDESRLLDEARSVFESVVVGSDLARLG